MNVNIVGMIWALCVLLVVMMAEAGPVYYGGYSGAYRGGRGRSGGRSYNDIARVINPSPYANVRGVPFPAQPFWTFTGWDELHRRMSNRFLWNQSLLYLKTNVKKIIKWKCNLIVI